ncbi:MAG: hypothetical protein ACXVCH_03595 [Bdellovibrionota bacterium]
MRKPLKRIVGQALLVFALCQGIFIGLHFLRLAIPVDFLRHRITDGFREGALTDEHYPGLNVRVGFDQLSDCAILHMNLLRPASVVENALGADFLMGMEGAPCVQLRELAASGYAPGRPYMHYSRYWHGPQVLSSFLLVPFSVSQVRRLIQAFGIALLLAIGYMMLRTSVPKVLLALPLFGLFYSGWLYYGQSFTHAPAFLSAYLLLGIGWRWRRLESQNSWRLFLIVSGCVQAFLDQMSGGVPLGMVMLCIAFFLRHRRIGGRDFLEIGGLYCSSVLMSILFKQILARQIVDPDAFGGFVTELAFRVNGGVYAHWSLFHRLQDNFGLAANGFGPFGVISTRICVIVLLAELLILPLLAYRKRLSAQTFQLASLSFFVLLVEWAWFATFRNHTAIHAFFMCRILFVPMSLVVALAISSGNDLLISRRKALST